MSICRPAGCRWSWPASARSAARPSSPIAGRRSRLGKALYSEVDEMLRPPRVRSRRSRVRRLDVLSLNRMIPNILTLLALCAGMTAIRYALGGKFEASVIAILVAGVFDGLDGRVARLLKSASPFGAQLDSMSDFVCFAVAPAVV